MSYVPATEKWKHPKYHNENHIEHRSGALSQIKKQIGSIDLDFVQVKTQCDIHGELTSFVHSRDAENASCQKCKWDADEFKNRIKDQQEHLFNQISMPAEHKRQGFEVWRVMGDDELKTRQGKIIARLKRYVNNYGNGAPNILLTGNTGTGKTKLACLVANEIVRNRFSPRMSVVFKRSSQICEEARSTWHRNSKDSEANYIERLTKATVLIIDEVGEGDLAVSSDMAEADRERLSAIIDGRYQRGLSTILTTNMTKEQFFVRIGDRAADRLSQRLIDIPCTWISYRQLMQTVEVI